MMRSVGRSRFCAVVAQFMACVLVRKRLQLGAVMGVLGAIPGVGRASSIGSVKDSSRIIEQTASRSAAMIEVADHGMIWPRASELPMPVDVVHLALTESGPEMVELRYW